MKSHRLLPVMLAAATFLGACVTINVYFPGPAAQKAADQIIDNVWSQPAADGETSQASSATPPMARLDFKRYLAAAAGTLRGLLIADANAAVKFRISSPAIRRIEQSMRDRFASMKPYYQSGAIGLTHNGLVAVHDLNAVPLPKRNAVKKLVADENADRQSLYREIAAANGHPEWEEQIRETFAAHWIKKAPTGWYYQDSGGAWHKK